jgi:hypothetical protein
LLIGVSENLLLDAEYSLLGGGVTSRAYGHAVDLNGIQLG